VNVNGERSSLLTLDAFSGQNRRNMQTAWSQIQRQNEKTLIGHTIEQFLALKDWSNASHANANSKKNPLQMKQLQRLNQNLKKQQQQQPMCQQQPLQQLPRLQACSTVSGHEAARGSDGCKSTAAGGGSTHLLQLLLGPRVCAHLREVKCGEWFGSGSRLRGRCLCRRSQLN
jgi:hypothetical protein